jgi:polysaccharide export outer membrane protein
MRPGSLAAAMVLTACAGHQKAVWVEELPVEAQNGHTYHIRAGDLIEVFVWNQERFSGPRRVRPDGRIMLPLIGDIEVAGTSPEAASRAIAARLQGMVHDANVAVSVSETRATLVSVIGEVRNPGRFTVGQGDALLDIIAYAGGLTEFADGDAIFVLRGDTRIRFSFERLVQGGGPGNAFRFRDGDVVVVEE